MPAHYIILPPSGCMENAYSQQSRVLLRISTCVRCSTHIKTLMAISDLMGWCNRPASSSRLHTKRVRGWTLSPSFRHNKHVSTEGKCVFLFASGTEDIVRSSIFHLVTADFPGVFSWCNIRHIILQWRSQISPKGIIMYYYSVY